MAARRRSRSSNQSGFLRVWLQLHASNCIGSLGRLLRHPFANFMTILVIGITLALPAAMHLMVKNAASMSGRWENALDFSMYLHKDVSLQDAERLADIIRQRADVREVTLISAEQGKQEFKAQSGFGAALDHLTNNPLPHTLIVRPGSASTEQTVLLLNEELSNLPEADFVQVDTEWVQRFLAFLDIARRAVLMGGTLLGIAITVIIGNTIRLDIQNRREEIEVTKLIGASNAFVRRPFLYSGLWYGLFGGLLALALIGYGLHALSEPVARLSSLYDSTFAVLSLDPLESLAIVATGVFLGLAGSWVATARHMRAIEPK